MKEIIKAIVGSESVHKLEKAAQRELLNKRFVTGLESTGASDICFDAE